MLKRTFSTLFLWSIIGLLLYLGGGYAGVYLLTILSALTQLELYQLLRKIGHIPYSFIGLSIGVLLMLGTWYVPLYGYASPAGFILLVLTLTVLVLSISLLFRPCKPGLPIPLMPTLFGIVLIPFFLQFFIQIVFHYACLGEASQGLMLVLWFVATAKFSDIGGLLVGKVIGRHKMAPIISPNKTWEGALGGVAFSVGLGFVVFKILSVYLPLNFTAFKAIAFALPISILAIVSDLVQSALKRQAQAKDSGCLIPGIGGAFDLTDSLILTAPLAYGLSLFYL
jgi:phosphatidate cytidylyltransferase